MNTDPGMLKQNDISAVWLGFLTSLTPLEEQDVINTLEEELDFSSGSRGKPEVTSPYLPAYVKLAVYLMLYPSPLFHAEV